MTATSHDRDDIREDGDWPTLTHADRPVVEEDSAVVAAVATEDLTVLRSPGECSEPASPSFTPWPAWWPSYATGPPVRERHQSPAPPLDRHRRSAGGHIG